MESYQNQLRSIQNLNGGGLSISVTGKYTSVRHELAKEAGKLTAGETAKLLKKHGIIISARKLVENFKIYYGHEPEWHHAGFYKGQYGKTMGRTFFFDRETIERLIKDWDKIERLVNFENLQKSEIVRGFYYIWDCDYQGYRGKKRNFKKLQAYEGTKGHTPKHFVKVEDEEIWERINRNIGKVYYGWDEPDFNNI